MSERHHVSPHILSLIVAQPPLHDELGSVREYLFDAMYWPWLGADDSSGGKLVAEDLEGCRERVRDDTFEVGGSGAMDAESCSREEQSANEGMPNEKEIWSYLHSLKNALR
jgi:hypothetical protein